MGFFIDLYHSHTSICILQLVCLKIDQRAKDILKGAIASSVEDEKMIPKQAITMQHLPLRHHFWYILGNSHT